MEEATRFIHAYGFNISDTEDVELLWGAFDDAVTFIEKSLTDAQYPKVPEHLKTRQTLSDLRRLLLLASGELGSPDQVWSCAILRVMHALIHLYHDPRLKYFDQVQNQILGRLDDYLYVESADGATYLGGRGDEGAVKLLFFKKKDRKNREREIVKLLHKADNLVEEIYDRIGFRLVTETKFDAIRAVKLLIQKNIVSLPNLRPGRSRNRLVDMGRLHGEIDRMLDFLVKYPDPDPVDYDRMMRRLERRITFRRLGRSVLNPHSSDYYRSIQFTCRELVKVKNPIHQAYEKLKKGLEDVHGGIQVLHDAFTEVPKPYEYVFFPFEVQIMDVKSYADSMFGRSSHEEYRRKQLEAARNRIFGRLAQ
jgi:uncharacterized protein (TIGR04562 family)